MNTPVPVEDVLKKRHITTKILPIILVGILLISASILAYFIFSPAKIFISNQSRYYQLTYKPSTEFTKFLGSLKFTKSIEIVVADTPKSQSNADEQSVTVKLNEHESNSWNSKIKVIINNQKTNIFTEKELSNITSVQIVSIIYATTHSNGNSKQNIEDVNNFNYIFAKTNTQPFSLIKR